MRGTMNNEPLSIKIKVYQLLNLTRNTSATKKCLFHQGVELSGSNDLIAWLSLNICPKVASNSSEYTLGINLYVQHRVNVHP
jgi:hypothetical protein